MTTLTLILTLRPHIAIIINKDKQESAMSEVDLKSKVGCFLPKSPQVILGTSRRLEVDLGSLLYQVGTDWHTKVTPRSNFMLIACGRPQGGPAHVDACGQGEGV